MEKPRIRAVEAFPVEQNNQTLICLRDPTGLAPEPIALAMGAYFLVTLFDGTNTRGDIQAAFMKRFGELLPSDKLDQLIDALDRAHYLDSPAFQERVRQVRDEFRASPERPAVHAGLCYSKQPAEVRREIESFFARADGPGPIGARRTKSALSGLIAPHIDPRRGATAYAHAYAELMRHDPPELIVILGTSHYGGGPELYSATKKNYATPLGTVETDREFIDRLASRYSGDLFADELLHRNEHSIEFQALFLAWALGTRGYKVVPILVSSFHEMVERRAIPAEDPRVASFLDALREEITVESRKVLVLAGVDFAHVGKKFGDRFAADTAVVDRVKSEDHTLIDHITRGDPARFFTEIVRERDRNKICGLAPMYTQLELLRGRTGRLLNYGVALEPETESAVTFASLAID